MKYVVLQALILSIGNLFSQTDILKINSDMELTGRILEAGSNYKIQWIGSRSNSIKFEIKINDGNDRLILQDGQNVSEELIDESSNYQISIGNVNYKGVWNEFYFGVWTPKKFRYFLSEISGNCSLLPRIA